MSNVLRQVIPRINVIRTKKNICSNSEWLILNKVYSRDWL